MLVCTTYFDNGLKISVSYSDIGKYIGYLRREKNIKQKDLAREANLSRVAISLIENGHCVPRAHTVASIAVAMGVTVAEIWAGCTKYTVEQLGYKLVKN